MRKPAYTPNLGEYPVAEAAAIYFDIPQVGPEQIMDFLWQANVAKFAYETWHGGPGTFRDWLKLCQEVANT
jgi:hypothetical protein